MYLITKRIKTMKTRIKTLALLLIVISSAAIANTGSDSSKNTIRVVPSKATNSYMLFYGSVNSESTVVELTDVDKTVLYKKVYVGDEFVQPFDLQFLPLGTYTLKVKNSTSEFTEKIALEPRTEIFNAIAIEAESELRSVKVASAGAFNSILKLVIVNGDGELVHSDEIHPSVSTRKSYNLTNIAGNGFTFYLYENGNLVKEKSIEF
jgi:hypothetical protein